MAQSGSTNSSGSKSAVSAPSGKHSGGGRSTHKTSSGSGRSSKGERKNGVNIQLMPSHMHRTEKGGIGIKGKFTAWPTMEQVSTLDLPSKKG